MMYNRHEKSFPTINYERITPEVAEAYLSTMTVNRNVLQRRVSQMTEDIKNGEWVTTHQGIAFNEDGALCDGQHRLHAIIEANTPIWVAVARGVPNHAMPLFDTGTPRTTLHSAHVSGMDWVSGKMASTAKRMMLGQNYFNSITISRPKELQFIEQHKEALSFVADVFRTNSRVNRAAVRAAVGVAYYHVPTDCLRQFVGCLYKGYSTRGQGDAGALLLYAWIMRLYASKGSNGEIIQIKMYLKTQRAIRAFVDQEPLQALFPPADELYLLLD